MTSTRRLLLGLAGVIVAAATCAATLLRPPPDEYSAFVGVLVVPGIIAAIAAPLLRRWVSTRSSIATTSLTVGLCSLATGAISSSGASRAMFLSSHDYRMFVVLLLLASGIALVVGGHLADPLSRDIRRLGAVAQAVADGDLTQLTHIGRRDEVGQAAAAVDRMVARLADTDREREAVAGARQHLLSSVSHDLRTPLTATRAAIESIRDGLAADPDRYLAVAERHLSAMEQLLDQLHQYARIESGRVGDDRHIVSLAELADDAVEALRPIADPRGIRLMSTATGAGYVLANASEISRVLRNVLDNAIRHSPLDGHISVTVTDGDVIRLAVSDEGLGFPETFRPVAFDPFTRADDARASSGSSGLGLAIAKALVEGHDGTISLGAGPGGDVIIQLPAHTAHQHLQQ